MSIDKRIVCTIITKNYLSFARVLATTLKEYNSDIELYVLLADKVDGYFEPSKEPFSLILLDDLPDHNTIDRMCFYYTPFELSCALRGMLHEYIYDNLTSQSWIFLDSDIMVFNSIDSIYKQLEKTSILLSPHYTSHLEIANNMSQEKLFLLSGFYNGGFLGLRRDDVAKKFISWFKERLNIYSFDDVNMLHPRGFFVDQKWLNFVPIYFKNVDRLQEPGANLGHWNLLERKLNEGTNGNITVNKQPLLFVHFSGWDISTAESKISKFTPHINIEDVPLWRKLSKAYKARLLTHDYHKTHLYPYGFAKFSSGESITQPMRRRYYDELMAGTLWTQGASENSPFDNYPHFAQTSFTESQPPAYLKKKLRLAKHTIREMERSIFWKTRTKLKEIRDWTAKLVR